jgi:anti-anti-sigma factor
MLSTTFQLKGGLTFSDHTLFRTVLTAITDEKLQSISIDLANLDYIDSAGLGMLLLAREMAQEANVSLTLAHPRNQVKKMFDISQFENLFNIANDYNA